MVLERSFNKSTSIYGISVVLEDVTKTNLSLMKLKKIVIFPVSVQESRSYRVCKSFYNSVGRLTCFPGCSPLLFKIFLNVTFILYHAGN